MEPTEATEVEWGLRHSNGYIRWFRSRAEAEARKLGLVIDGRPGDWVSHDLVYRVITTTWGEPKAVQ